jgi:carboxyl-terminal processing protease
LDSKKKWIKITIAIVLVTNIITFFVVTAGSLYLPNGKVLITKAQYDQVMKFQKMFAIENQLYKYYDGAIDDAALTEGAIKGMTSALNDPYTVFMNKKEYSDFNTQTQGNYSGVGLQVQDKDNKIYIVSVFEDTPAKKAGVLPKDIILKVNGTSVTGADMDKAVTMMKGADGTPVTIDLYRDGKGEFAVTMNRAKINMKTVTGEMIGSNIGYIQVTMFDENTATNFKKELDTLKASGMKALVLDLRGNPGGLLNECVDMVSNFVQKDKVIVSTIDKYNTKKNYNSTGGDYIGLPMVILTDEGTASASEIFSGAIKDYKLGTLVGAKTFGKGVVQSIIETGDGTALKVTISKYYTPNGINIQHIGINPDVSVAYPDSLRKLPYDKNTDPQYKKALEIIKQKLQ